MTRHDYKPRHAAAARLLGECPFPSADPTKWLPTLAEEYDQLRRDGWMAASGTLAARLEDAGLRGRMAVSLLEDGWAAVVLWALAGVALATLAALAGRLLGAG
jgi:hypothetical protein